MHIRTDSLCPHPAAMAPPRRRLIRLLAVLLTLLAAGAAGRAASAATGPSIQLFPSAILEDIKHTGRVAQDMETGLQETIARLDQQQQLYQASKCEG
ncbi:MAG: hypothetical protein PVI15_06140, partial [Chromatiales bacterium]